MRRGSAHWHRVTTFTVVIRYVLPRSFASNAILYSSGFSTSLLERHASLCLTEKPGCRRSETTLGRWGFPRIAPKRFRGYFPFFLFVSFFLSFRGLRFETKELLETRRRKRVTGGEVVYSAESNVIFQVENSIWLNASRNKWKKGGVW